MLEKGKISSFQMGIMMYPVVVGTADLLLPGITAKFAKNDLWISPIIASLTGLFTVYIAYQLHRLYPKQTIIQYSEHIIGRIPGKILGIIYLFFFLHVNGLIIRQYGEFIIGTSLPRTPLSVIISTIILVCAFAVRGGLEVLGRASQLFVPIVILLWGVILILLIPDMDPKNILPILEKGIVPPIMGAITPMGWFTHFILISFLLPFVTDQEKGMKWGIISIFGIMLTLVLLNMTSFFVFGRDTAKYLYPAMNAVRYISIANFFEHMESVMMAIWVSGTFIKISVYYYALVLGTAQWLNLSDCRPVVFPLGFLLILFSFWSIPSLVELVHFLRIVPFYNMTIEMVIPTFLLLIAVLRKKNRKKVS
ncbi:GerAB/ArcD/ProY family transporter [Ectobacillus panaciterrae]|uniref:GerAB/ArcD/ProY family transporter n=1 Tax=Ectobacillus panaciterrae TaxID=363872 RepID=UPI00040A62A0|nr:endospore germination permease [Ectobacillus panaciterrae]